MSKRIFEQHIKEQIESYEPSNCPDIWADLEVALDGEKRSKRMVPWWMINVAASLVLIATAGLLMYNFTQDDSMIASLPIESDTVRRIVDAEIRPNIESTVAMASAEIARSSSVTSSKQATGIKRRSAATQSHLPLFQSSSVSSKGQEVMDVNAQPVHQEEKVSTRSTTTTHTTTTRTATTTKHLESRSNESLVKKKSVESPLLFSVATNNSVVSISQRNNTVKPLYKSGDRRLMGLMQLANAEILPKTELQHFQPITVSLTARKRLAEHFSLEAGLAYSYLYSKTKTNIGVERNESQELHYVGVPISGIVDIVKSKRWSIYGKAGGQIDVNVSGKWNEKWSEQGREFASSTVVDLESKPQFSAHLALGLGYKLSPNVQLSLEPGVNYYFNNESEVENIYKERPLSGSINVALSYLF